jgi:hypothetical protein
MKIEIPDNLTYKELDYLYAFKLELEHEPMYLEALQRVQNWGDTELEGFQEFVEIHALNCCKHDLPLERARESILDIVEQVLIKHKSMVN